jgi:hypothetical protein
VTTDEELQKLAADGLAPKTRVWITHFFSHFGASERDRATFRDALLEAGFGTIGKFAEIGTDEEATDDGYWHHWTFTVFEASPERLRGADEVARELAHAHGVRYDGWMVQRQMGDVGSPKLGNEQD